MSGTSMDGITAVLVDLNDSQPPKLLRKTTTEYPAELHQQLERLVSPDWKGPLAELSKLDHQVGKCFAKAALSVIPSKTPSEIQAIGSHGQTIYHSPPPGSPNSLQIGDPNIIVETTGIDVVSDFRRRDMAAGGQGAPLVPAFHQFVFGDLKNRGVLNLGGIANITLQTQSGQMKGYDTGPANTLLDRWIKQKKNLAFDTNGEWAKSGTINQELLSNLLSEPYFKLTPPKSSGRELFNMKWLNKHLRATNTELASEDVQATLTELTAITTSKEIKSHQLKETIVCGGGAHNKHLISRIKQHLPNTNVVSSLSYGVDPDDMEAMAFAWLAQQTLNANTGNIPQATGSSGHRILGTIYQA